MTMDTVFVELGARRYPIYIGQNLIENALNYLGPLDGQQIAVVTNPTVNKLYGERLRSALDGFAVDWFEMEDGEAHKNFQTYSQLMDFLMAARHNRTTCVLALGGGVVGDMAGFAAATFQRGVKFVQIPTTLLAQVDSSVGGKTAVNHPAGKNMIGAFYQPQSVLISTDVLQTLPAREYAAGLAEVVKYGMIEDPKLFDYMVEHVDAIKNQNADVLRHVIQRSCEIKAAVVAADEREGGVRAILNFGHTFGHAIENLTGYGTLLHGEAVAVGMLMATRFSQRLGRAPQNVFPKLRELLEAFGLPTRLPSGVTSAELLDAMGMDKKTVDGQIRFVLGREIGQVDLVSDYAFDALASTLDEFAGPTS
jgi:3-dehydroquinate synthase